MRRIALLFLVATAFPAVASARTPCALGKQDRVVTRSQHSVVAKRPNNGPNGWGYTYRACLRSTSRWRVLHEDEWDGYAGSSTEAVALGGRYAAVAVFAGDHYNAGTATIEIVNLHTGHRRPALLAGRADGDIGGSHFGVSGLAVSSKATVGWITAEDYDNGPDGVVAQSRVVAHDEAGTRALDTAAGWGALRGVRFSGTKLHWTHDGKKRSAQLAGR